MDKKFLIISMLALLTQQQIYSYYNDGFGGGFATGAILGTGLTLAATSGSRNSRDPYYDLERAQAQQELREIRAENRLRQEEERQRRRLKREEEREEREYQKQLQQKQREEEKAIKRKQRKLKENEYKKSTPKYSKNQHHNNKQSSQHNKTTESPEDLQLEIKKLEREIAQLKLNHSEKR